MILSSILSTFLEFFDANVIALHWGLAGPTFGVEKLKLKLPSVEQMKKNTKFVHQLHLTVGKFILNISTIL
jgi:hypothetical protein